MLSRRSRTLCLKSSSVHRSSVPPPEPPAPAERPSLSSLCMSHTSLGCQRVFHGAKRKYPLGSESSLKTNWGSRPAELLAEVFLEDGSPKFNFGFTAFYEVRMQILHRSPRERREVDFRSCASKR
jgi:hypothetical protein